MFGKYGKYTGIYRATNIVNGKIWIGSAATSLSQRYASHRSLFKRNKNSPRFQNAWNKYGADAFMWDALMVCDRDFCIYYEQLFLDKLRPYDPSVGYNICSVAGSTLGVRWTESQRVKITNALIGNKYTLGHKLTDEHKEKISKAGKGRKMSAEFCLKTKERMIGHKVSEETREKLRQKNLGKNVTAATKAKLSLAKKGKKKPEGFGEKVRAGNLKLDKGRHIILTDFISGYSVEFVSLHDAAKHGYNRKSISMACKNQKPYRGMVFMFKD